MLDCESVVYHRLRIEQLFCFFWTSWSVVGVKGYYKSQHRCRCAHHGLVAAADNRLFTRCASLRMMMWKGEILLFVNVKALKKFKKNTFIVIVEAQALRGKDFTRALSLCDQVWFGSWTAAPLRLPIAAHCFSGQQGHPLRSQKLCSSMYDSESASIQ